MPVTPDDIIEAIKKALKMIEDIISDLNDLFEEMESFEIKRNVAKTVGTTTNCVGAGAAIVGAFFTGGLSLIPLLVITAVGTATNGVTDIIDNFETKKCIKKIENLVKKFDDQMKKLQKLIEKFNELVEDSMRTQNIDRNRAFFLLFGCPIDVDVKVLCWLASSYFLQVPLATVIVELASCLQVVSKTFGFLFDDVALLLKFGGKSAFIGSAKTGAAIFETAGQSSLIATAKAGTSLVETAKAGTSLIESGSATVAKAGAGSVAKIIGKGAAVTGVVFTAWEVADLVKTLSNDHPSLKAIENVRKELGLQKSKLNEGLTEFQKILTAARNATVEAIITFLQKSLGGGYRKSGCDTTVTPLTFSEFVDQIGYGTEGGIYHLIFLAEMEGRTIEVFDRTSDHSLRRQYGTDHLKIDPFVELSRKPIRIERTGEEGAYHYRPLSADGSAIEIAANSPYANRCLFDAIAYQLRVSTDTLIAKFKSYIRNDNSVAQELYEENIQEIFPEFQGGATQQRPRNGKQVVVTRNRRGNQETLTATVVYENLYQGSAARPSVRREIQNEGIGGWDHVGHLIAKVLGGGGNDVQNFAAMHSSLNTGQYRVFELEIKQILMANPTLRADITVTMTYDPNSDYPRRPTKFHINVRYFDASGKFLYEVENSFNNNLPG